MVGDCVVSQPSVPTGPEDTCALSCVPAEYSLLCRSACSLESHSSHFFVVPPNSQYYGHLLSLFVVADPSLSRTYFGWKSAHCVLLAKHRKGLVPNTRTSAVDDASGYCFCGHGRHLSSRYQEQREAP